MILEQIALHSVPLLTSSQNENHKKSNRFEKAHEEISKQWLAC